MAHTTHFDSTQVQEHLLTLEEARSRLAATEPLIQQNFVAGRDVSFRVNDAWAHGAESVNDDAPIEVFLTTDGAEMQLTKNSLFDITSHMKLNSREYVTILPAKLLEDQLNFMYRGGMGEKEFKILSVNSVAHAVVRGALQPFSNLQILDNMLSVVEGKYGQGNVFVDKKMTHNLDQTYLRLIIPEQTRVIENTGTDNDTWSIGVQLRNSLTGLGQTSMDGYLFRWWCTNGCIDTRNEMGGAFSRRGANGQGDAVYDWARESVDGILGGLEGALDRVQHLTQIPVDGQVESILEDAYRFHKIPKPLRERINANMLNEPNLTMYGVMQAITAAANGDEINPAHAELLMQVGGEMAYTGESRCNLGSLHAHR